MLRSIYRTAALSVFAVAALPMLGGVGAAQAQTHQRGLHDTAVAQVVISPPVAQLVITPPVQVQPVYHPVHRPVHRPVVVRHRPVVLVREPVYYDNGRPHYRHHPQYRHHVKHPHRQHGRNEGRNQGRHEGWGR